MVSLFLTRKIILNILPELKHSKFIYKLVCKDTQVPIVLYLSSNCLHRPGYGINEAVNFMNENILREATRIPNTEPSTPSPTPQN